MEGNAGRLIPMGELTPEVHRLILQKKLPLRGAEGLERFSREEQRWLAQNVFDRLHLTTNQLIRFSEWAFDLKKRDKRSLEEVFRDERIQGALNHPKLNLRAKGERLFETLRSLRFPKLSQEAAKAGGSSDEPFFY